MADKALQLEDFDEGEVLRKTMARHKVVSEHMFKRLSLECLLSAEDSERHFPQSTGTLDAAFAGRMSSLQEFKKALRAFKNSNFVRQVLNSGLVDT